MCGLVGFTGSPQPAVLQKMTDQIAHRGPDDQGFWSDDLLSLGHRRLSILDLSAAGHQPMESPDGRYVLAFNGEIYTHQTIRDELADRVTFHSTSDTETLLYGLIHFGEELLPRLNGIFAFAFYDTQTHQLLIARDQFGIKPLYYTLAEGRLAFASELKSLLNLKGWSRQIDPKGIANYLTFLWSPGGRTAFEAVHKLTPGCYAKVDLSQPVSEIQEICYYRPPFHGEFIQQNGPPQGGDVRYRWTSESHLIDDLDRHLQTAIERQLLSDVPVGFFLSGGLDSSLLVALARKLRPNAKLQAFTIDTTGVESTEGFVSDLDYARKVADHLQADLEVVDPSCDLLKLFDQIVWHLDEPQADAAPMNVLAICQRARAIGYKVLIGGAAADDLFSGYRRHEALALEKWFRLLPGPLAHVLGAVARCLPARPAAFRRLRKLAEGLGKSASDRMVGYFGWIEQSRIFELLSPEIRKQLAGFDPLDQLRSFLKEIPNEVSALNQMLYLELRSFLVDHNLNYTDKLSMATSVEVRVPFLDLDLVEFSTRIPPELKMQGRTTKYLLRKVAERYLPHDVIYRPKAGFGGPVRKWVLQDLAPMISQRLSPERIRTRGLFDSDGVQKLLQDNRSGKIDAAYTIWTLLAIESWCEQFVDHQ